MSRLALSAIQRATSVPFSMERGGSVVTSAFGLMCVRRASSKAMKPYDAKIRFVELPNKFCDEVYRISQDLIAQKVTIPSSKFTAAVTKVRERCSQDADLAEAIAEFKSGKIQSIVFEGKFAPVVADIKIDANVQHIRREGQKTDKAKALEAVNKSLPDLLFAAALTDNERITQFDHIESISPQYPHVDFDSNPETGESQDTRTNIIFFAGICRDSYPSIATAAIPVSEILRYFSDQEIEFLRGKYFAISRYDDMRGGENLSETFAIIDNQSMKWDGLTESKNSIRAIASHPDFDAQELLKRINKISALLLHHNMVPMAILNDNTKMIMRNYDRELGNVLHFRVEAAQVEEGAPPQYSNDPARIFGKSPDGVVNFVLPQGSQGRQIIRIGFFKEKVGSTLPAKEVSAPLASSVASELNSTQTEPQIR